MLKYNLKHIFCHANDNADSSGVKQAMRKNTQIN